MKLQKIALIAPKQQSTFSSLPCPFFATPFSAGLYHRPHCRVHPALRLSQLLQSRRLASRLRQLHFVLPQRLRLHAEPTEADNAVPVSKWFVFRRAESRQGVGMRLRWRVCSKAPKSHHGQLLIVKNHATSNDHRADSHAWASRWMRKWIAADRSHRVGKSQFVHCNYVESNQAIIWLQVVNAFGNAGKLNACCYFKNENKPFTP